MKLKTYKPETLIKNIIKMYNVSNDSDKLAGNFYTEAAKFAQNCAMDYNYTFLQCCGVIAATSPATSWELNKQDTIKLLSGKGKKFATYGNNVAKARKILKVTELDKIYSIIYGKVGYKTSNFFLNITGNFDVVTVDRHAAKIAINKADGGPVSLTLKQYNLISDSYIIAARKLNIKPAILQAITWNCFKRINKRGKYTDIDGGLITSDCPF